MTAAVDGTPDIPFDSVPSDDRGAEALAAFPAAEDPAPEAPRTLSMHRAEDVSARMDTEIAKDRGFVPIAPPRLRALLVGLLKAQRAIHAVAKSGTNQHHKYDYATSEDIIAEGRRALLEGGLVLRRTSHYVLVFAGLPHLISRFELAHAESGEVERYEFPWPIIIDKGRPEDKALSAALTTSLSYWLRDLLLIPKSDEESTESRDDRNFDPAQARGAPAPAKSSVTIGVKGAVRVRGLMQRVEMKQDELRNKVESEAGPMPTDLAEWPAALLPRIEQWLETIFANRAAVNRSATIGNAV